jgi:xanthine/CO dehydrogenase XdhC/CoxF family maturation factor
MERMAGDVEKREVSTGGNGREAEAERLIPRRRIIGTAEGGCVENRLYVN